MLRVGEQREGWTALSGLELKIERGVEDDSLIRDSKTQATSNWKFQSGVFGLKLHLLPLAPTLTFLFPPTLF